MMTRPGTVTSVGLCAAICMIAAANPMFAEVLPHDLKIEKVFDTAADMGDLAQSPLGELWLLEKMGTLRVLTAGVEEATLTLPVATNCGGGLVDVAFPPEYGSTGRALVYWVDSTGKARIDEIFKQGATLGLGANLLDLGTTPGGCRPGGGMAIGADEKLYVGVGDLETAADAQDDGKLAGKVLRMELDGGVPVDNASGSLVWSKGYFDGTDLDVGSTGTVYLADEGFRNLGVADEVNAVREGDNHGWDDISGDSGGAYDDPLVTYLPPVGTEAVQMLTSDALGQAQQDTLLYSCATRGELLQVELGGADLDEFESVDLFYNSEGDPGGTPDAGCPEWFNALGEGGEGWLYGANSGVNPGIWRIWHDGPGPREVSAPGSPLELTVAPTDGGLEIGWEHLGPLDSGRPARHGNQHAQAYQIWEGDLDDVAGYAHGSILATDGTSAGPARRTAEVAPAAGSRYYLVSAQNDNLEGSVGAASDGTPRPVPGTTDYCEQVGYGVGVGQCAAPWYDYFTSGELRLTDYNPNSPTFGQLIGLNDFRGKVIRMDISALNCTYCRQQADNAANVEAEHGSRDFVAITVLSQSFSGVPAIPASSCATQIAAWANNYGCIGPIVCDVDRNGDGHGDVSWQYWVSGPTCGGTPQNFYIDQGHTQYRFRCGGQLTDGSIYVDIVGEINPEICE